MRSFSMTFAAALVATTATAQDNPNTILVLDGSGSMWGQIDGVAKISIAQDVVGGLLSDFPADQGLGLTVYGHRQRGDCTDIETIVAPAAGTSSAIADAVANIKPLGKTPMTDAVIAAAEALRYTEDSATVILVSDGVETCNPDPCAAARLLEEAGIDFTAHVVGFDVGSDPAALAQMQCIAAETGGQFITADNADQLTEALNTVAAAIPEPEPALVPLMLTAVEGESGTIFTDPVLWNLTGDAGEVFSDQSGNPFETTVAQGSYTVSAYRLSTETTMEQQFVAIGDNASVTITFPAPVESAALIAPETAILGADIQVGWDGPGGENDYIAVADPEKDGFINYTYTREGQSLDLTMPPEAGTYEIRYVSEPNREVLATKSIEVLPAEVQLEAAATAEKGADLVVAWVGPDYDNDFISVGLPGETSYANYTYTRDGTPLKLLMPTEVGEYEIRYHLRQDNTIIATRPITVTDVTVGLTAADTAIAGEDVIVGWEGPDYDNDFISVGLPGETRYINYSYTREGNPLGLQMPTEPGEYEIRYQLRQDNEIIATRPITVTKVEVALTAAETAVAGSQLTVEWEGPDYDNDFISVGIPGENRFINYTYTRDGSPLQLELPTEEGEYEIRYQLRQDNEIIATRLITTTKVNATLDVPATANAGESVTINWDGPDYSNDFISVGEVGETRYINYNYTRDGSPLTLEMPPIAGDYEVRYQLRQDNEIIVRVPVTVAAVKAQLVANATGQAGEEFVVGWDGPDYDNDYIAVSKVGDTGYETYARTNRGNPVTVTLPDEPGDYELRYIIRQDNTVIHTQPLTITE